MRLTIFSRLVLGYLAIFVVVMALSVYAILQLRRFNEITRSILNIDTRVLDYEKKLTDSFLSQIRYERKFILTKDNALFDEAMRFKRDFEQVLQDTSFVGGPETDDYLQKVRADYQQYQALLAKEFEFLKANQLYPQQWYREEKEKVADKILSALENLRIEGQQRMYGKVRLLADAGDKAGRVAVTIALASLVFIVVVSLVMTRSITAPISVLKRKTGEIAKGHFDGDLKLTSPPEVGELAAAFNSMCDKLKEVDKLKSDFFSSMSHELRTPLTSIKEGISLLLDGVGGNTTEKQSRLLTILAEESNRLIGVVNSLLDLSKMEAGMMTYEFEPSNVAPLMRRAVGEITPLIEAKKINLELKLDDDLPLIRLDRERILQALRNLIGNGVKFTPQGGRIRVSAGMDNGKVKVSVEDTGRGIPQEHLTTIFDKFHQVARWSGDSTKGTGLGLAIAKHIVTSHGGEIWAESEVGKGSAFIFVLPV